MPETGAGLRPVRSALSSREWEVLDLICAGIGTRGIAADLGLSVETVRSHVKRILRKLGAHSREEAAHMAAQMLAHRAVPVGGDQDRLEREERRFTRR
jgi:two-component system nitrate/nitrite response regulator NarL